MKVDQAPCGLWFTVGPASLGIVDQLIEAGGSGARLTFSFGTPRLQEDRARALKEIARSKGVDFKIMADLPGEKFRLGVFPEGMNSVQVSAGERVSFCFGGQSNPCGSPKEFVVPERRWFRTLAEGALLVVGDDAAHIRILAFSDDSADGEAVDSGTIEQGRGLSFRGGRHNPECLTQRDRDVVSDIVSSTVYDVIALSFVDSSAPIRYVRKVAEAAGRSDLAIAAKVESAAGLENLPDIASAADMLVAARGDLALALDWRDVGLHTEAIAEAAHKSGKRWILATQIAEGIDYFNLMTRAEISDLSRWLRLGCGGVLLTHETAFGRNPALGVKAVRAMISRFSSSTLSCPGLE